jgi:hypothetical protein
MSGDSVVGGRLMPGDANGHHRRDGRVSVESKGWTVEWLVGHHSVMWVRGLGVLAIALLLPVAGAAQVYRWDDDGTVNFTNRYERIPEPLRGQVDAPVPGAEEAPEPAPTEAPGTTHIPFTPGSPIFVNASIGGAGSLTLILDTGADRTMVSPEALGRIGIAVGDGPVAHIKGVTGSTEGSVVRVASIEVGQAKVGPIPIIAHDADLKRADGLLGRDFLEHFTVTIDSREQQVTLTPK